MFSLVGFLLTGYGLITGSSSELYKRSLGMNVNLWWGLVLLIFGGTMLYFAWRGSKQPPDSENH